MKCDRDLSPIIPDNIRILRIMLNELRVRGFYTTLESFPKEHTKQKLIKCLINQSNEFIKNLIYDAELKHIDDSFFDWIKSDRCIYFVWAKLRLKNGYETITAEPTSFHWDQKINLYPTTSKERKNIIFMYFDNMGSQSRIKRQLLEELKIEWNNIFEKGDPLKFIDKNDFDSCQRIWMKLKSLSPLCKWVKPTDNKELYQSIYAAFDVIENEEDKDILILKTSRNFSQKKWREQSKKVILNTYINEESKEKLKEITSKTGKKINETIEDMISDEYEKIKTIAFKHMGD